MNNFLYRLVFDKLCEYFIFNYEMLNFNYKIFKESIKKLSHTQ